MGATFIEILWHLCVEWWVAWIINAQEYKCTDSDDNVCACKTKAGDEHDADYTRESLVVALFIYDVSNVDYLESIRMLVYVSLAMLLSPIINRLEKCVYLLCLDMMLWNVDVLKITVQYNVALSWCKVQVLKITVQYNVALPWCKVQVWFSNVLQPHNSLWH